MKKTQSKFGFGRRKAKKNNKKTDKNSHTSIKSNRQNTSSDEDLWKQYEMFRDMASKGFDKRTIEITMRKAGLDPTVVLGVSKLTRDGKNQRERFRSYEDASERSSQVNDDSMSFSNGNFPPSIPPPNMRTSQAQYYGQPQGFQDDASQYSQNRSPPAPAASVVSSPSDHPQAWSPAMRRTGSVGNIDHVKTLRRTKNKKVFIQNPRTSQAVSVSDSSVADLTPVRRQGSYGSIHQPMAPSGPPPSRRNLRTSQATTYSNMRSSSAVMVNQRTSQAPSMTDITSQGAPAAPPSLHRNLRNSSNPNFGYQSSAGGSGRMIRSSSVENFQNRLPRTSFNELHVDDFMSSSSSKISRSPSGNQSYKKKKMPIKRTVAPGPNAFENELQNTLKRRKQKTKQPEVVVDEYGMQPSEMIKSRKTSYSQNAFQSKRSGFLRGTDNGSSTRTLNQNHQSEALSSSRTTRTTKIRRPLSQRPVTDTNQQKGEHILSGRQKDGIPLRLFPFNNPVYKKFKAMQVDGRDPRDVVRAMEMEGIDPIALYKDLDVNRMAHEVVKCDPESQKWDMKYSKRYFQHYYQNKKTGETIWKDEVDKLLGRYVPEEEEEMEESSGMLLRERPRVAPAYAPSHQMELDDGDF